MDELPTLEAAIVERDQLLEEVNRQQERLFRLNWLSGFIAHAQSTIGQNGSEPIPQGGN